jgi:O-antigen ligase
MTKLLFYAVLTGVGIIGALVNPVAGAAAAILAYLMNPAAIDMPQFIHYQQLTTIAFMIGVFLNVRRGSPRVGREGSVMIALWVFVVIAALSSLWAQYSGMIAIVTVFEVFKTIIVATLLVRAIQTERDLRIIMIACIVGVIHAATMHVLGARFGYISESHSREYGVLPDSQTAVMVSFVPLLLVVAATGRSKWERLLAWCALPLAIDSIVNTYQRTGLVSLAAEIILLFLFSGGRILRKVVPVALVAGALFVLRFTPQQYWDWMSTIEAPAQEASANSRFSIGKASIDMFIHHPFGVGYRNYPYVSHLYLPAEFLNEDGYRSAHNSFASVLCETGIQGFIAWIFAFCGALWLLRRVRKKVAGREDTMLGNYALALEIGIYGWMAGSLFQADHELDTVYWFVALSVVITRLFAQIPLDNGRSTLNVAHFPWAASKWAASTVEQKLGRAPMTAPKSATARGNYL